MADEAVEIARGHVASQLLENEMLRDAFEAIETHYGDAWRNSALSQVQLREEAFRMLAAVREVRKHLTRHIETGKLAAMSQSTRENTEATKRGLERWDGSPDGHPRI